MFDTKRLRVRQWQDGDMDDFILLNQDPAVMEFFPGVMTDSEVQDMVAQWRGAIETRGWGFFAVAELESKNFVGMVGLNEVPFTLPQNLTIEVGWRLSKAYWGKGYAVEAAKACLDYAFDKMPVDAICAFTPRGNMRSRRVMEKLSMKDLDEPFYHPRMESEHPLAEHVLYAISRIEHMRAREWNS